MGAGRQYPFERYGSYSRAEVAHVLAPGYRFQEQVGTWGLHGIVRFGEGANFAFFVTLGQVQGEHRFDEAVYESGVVRWQSQPRQGLDDRTIRKLISHDEAVNDILLFLRSRPRSPYLYLDRLKYLNHDREREHPVHFNWQLIDFDAQNPLLRASGFRLQHVSDVPEETFLPGREIPAVQVALRLEARPTARTQGLGLTTKGFQQTKIDYVARDKRNRSLGSLGEHLVAAHERAILSCAGRDDLAGQVEIVSESLGDGVGYDVRSF